MNKIGNSYSPYFHYETKNRKSHQATVFMRKQSQVQMIKKRISALCVRDQRYVQRTYNNQGILTKKKQIQEQSEKIKEIIFKKRRQQLKKIQDLRYKNQRSKADFYFKQKQNQKQREIMIKNRTQLLKKKSEINQQIIKLNKSQTISEKQDRNRMINQRQKQSRRSRQRYLMAKRQTSADKQQHFNHHLQILSSVKDMQIQQLGRLQLMMIQKSQTSRVAYEKSKEYLRKSSANSSRVRTITPNRY